MDVVRCQYGVALLSILATNVYATDVVATSEIPQVIQMLHTRFECEWAKHYKQHDIIKNLNLNKDKYAESIKNIQNIMFTSLENDQKLMSGSKEIKLSEEMKYAHMIGTRDKDILIVTNMSKYESIVAYLMRQEVENFNYILLENLMFFYLIGKAESTIDELLDWLVTKIENRLARLQDKAIIQKIITKVNKSAKDVKTYVEAGALNEFMISFTKKYLYNGNEDNEEREELGSESEQEYQNSSNNEEDEIVDINTKEGKEIVTNLVTNMYKLANIYEFAMITAFEFDKTGKLVKRYIYEVSPTGELETIYELKGTNELIRINNDINNDEIYSSAVEKEQVLGFSSEDETKLMQIAQQTKTALNEFEKRVNGGSTPRELMRILGLTFLERDEDDYPNEEEVDGGSCKDIGPIDTYMSRIWKLLVNFKDRITDDWHDVNIKVALLSLKPYLEKYLANDE